jgi:hypothetical protein
MLKKSRECQIYSRKLQGVQSNIEKKKKDDEDNKKTLGKC